jgi:hypothetical protein
VAHIEGDVRRELHHAARRRADAVGEIRDAPTPAGGDWCGYTMYERDEDNRPWIEMLALTTKRSRAMFLYVGYVKGRLELIPWLNLRAALLGRHTWQPDELDELQSIWPSGGAFSEPKLSLGYVGSGDQSEAKAEELGDMSNEEADTVNALLVREASSFVAPACAWSAPDTDRVTQAIRECASARATSIIVRDLSQAKTMHDFRRWCTLVKWAVDNKGRRRK